MVLEASHEEGPATFMVITCPSCQSRYRIDPAKATGSFAKVKCPGCQHLFEIALSDSAPAPSAPESEEVPAGRPRVLIVDDAKFFREMLKELLQELPVELLTAADGGEAMQLISECQPALLLLDLNIPEKSGREILQELRANPDFNATKVIVMSGSERGGDTENEVRRLGADDFLNKSFKPRELVKRVRQILGL